MIHSVLESLPIYYLSLFKIPMRVASRIEKLMRDFLWEGCGEGKKDHLVKWEVVSRPRNLGGLAVGNIITRNIALLGKWLWRFPLERDSLWHSVIKSRYGMQGNGWDSQIGIRASARCPRKFISQGLPRFLSHCSFVVGNGERIHFWEDVWKGDIPLSDRFPRLYSLSRAHNSSILDMVVSPSFHLGWDFRFFRNLNDREICEFSSLLSLLEGVVLRPSTLDRRRWLLHSSGIFSCHSFMESIILGSNENSFPPFKMIWKSKVPLKV